MATKPTTATLAHHAPAQRERLVQSNTSYEPLRVVQLSDTHLTANPETWYRGIRALPRLQRLAERIAEWRPDLIIASGDLSQDLSRVSYYHLHSALAAIGVPVITVPGNHDDPSQLNRPPWLPWWRTPIDAGAWTVLALDSHWGNRAEGLLSEKQLSRLQQLPPERPALLCLHHHPIAVNTPWVDRFPLLNGARLLQIVEQMPHIRLLTFGHIHHEWQATWQYTGGECELLGCPAASINTHPGVRQFSDDGTGGGARWFVLHQDGRWNSGTLRAAIR